MRLFAICKGTFDSLLAYRLGRWVLAFVFLYSGASKLVGIEELAELIAHFGLVHDTTASAAALALVVVELAAAAGVAFDVRGALAVASGLLVLFSAVLAFGKHPGLELESGCFVLGGYDREGGTLAGALSRDLALLALCGYLYWLRFRNGTRPRHLVRSAQRVFSRRLPSEHHENRR